MREEDVQLQPSESVFEMVRYVELRASVTKLLRMFQTHAADVRTMRIWCISSTSKGGGVAEMLPRLICLLREMGVEAHWMIMEVDTSFQKGFFDLTKHIHNNIHGEGEPLSSWTPDWLTAGSGTSFAAGSATEGLGRFRALFEAVGDANAAAFLSHLCADGNCGTGGDTHTHRDVLVVHDPQPAAIIRGIRAHAPGMPIIWRSHIGLDSENAATRDAWAFLQPYLASYDVFTFSAAEYIPASLAARAVVIHPGVAPLSNKNKHLSVYDVSQTLMRAGLLPRLCGCSEAGTHGCGLVDDAFDEQAVVYRPKSSADGSPPTADTPSSEAACADSSVVAFLQRPIVTQISRWDRLKGWIPLLEAWILLKSSVDEWAARTDFCNPREAAAHDIGHHRALLQNACLVLAGPDPSHIVDDPEGQQVYRDLCARLDKLPARVAADVKLVTLPMSNTHENALIVNAIQRSSLVIVQNSLREGFGLTATEALVKRVCFVGTQAACGLRTQVRHGVDGLLVQGDVCNPENVARVLNAALGNELLRNRLSVNGQKRAYDSFLTFSQMTAWLQLMVRLRQQASSDNKPVGAHAGKAANDAQSPDAARPGIIRRAVSLLSLAKSHKQH